MKTKKGKHVNKEKEEGSAFAFLTAVVTQSQ